MSVQVHGLSFSSRRGSFARRACGVPSLALLMAFSMGVSCSPSPALPPSAAQESGSLPAISPSGRPQNPRVQRDFEEALLGGNVQRLQSALARGANPNGAVALGQPPSSPLAELPLVIALARGDQKISRILAERIDLENLRAVEIQQILVIASVTGADLAARALRERYEGLQKNPLRLQGIENLARTQIRSAAQEAWSIQVFRTLEARGKTLETTLLMEALRRAYQASPRANPTEMVIQAQRASETMLAGFGGSPTGVPQTFAEKLLKGALTVGEKAQRFGKMPGVLGALSGVADEIVSQFSESETNRVQGYLGREMGEASLRKKQAAVWAELWKEAQQNPLLAFAVDGLLGEAVNAGIRESAAEILARNPESEATVLLRKALRPDGTLVMGLDEIQQELTKLQGSLQALQQSQNHTLEAVQEVLRSGGKNLRLEGQRTQITSSDLDAAAEREKALVELSVTLNLATTLAKVAGLDEKVVSKVQAVGQTGIQITRSVDRLIQQVGVDPSGAGLGLASAVLTLDVVSGVSSLLSLLGDVPSSDQQILRGIENLGAQLSALGDHLDDRLDGIQTDIRSGFRFVSQQFFNLSEKLARMERSVGQIQGQLSQMTETLDRISSQMTRAQSELVIRLEAGFDREWIRTQNRCNGGTDERHWRECFRLGKVRAELESRDALSLASLTEPLPSPRAPATEWKAVEGRRFLNSQLQRLEGLAGLDVESLSGRIQMGNLEVWAQGVNFITQLLERDPARATGYELSSVEQLTADAMRFRDLHAELLNPEPHGLARKLLHHLRSGVQTITRPAEAQDDFSRSRGLRRPEAFQGDQQSPIAFQAVHGCEADSDLSRGQYLFRLKGGILPEEHARLLLAAFANRTLHLKLKTTEGSKPSGPIEAMGFCVRSLKQMDSENFRLDLSFRVYFEPGLMTGDRWAALAWATLNVRLAAGAPVAQPNLLDRAWQDRAQRGEWKIVSRQLSELSSALRVAAFDADRERIREERAEADRRITSAIEGLRQWLRLALPELGHRDPVLASFLGDLGAFRLWSYEALLERVSAAALEGDVSLATSAVTDELNALEALLKRALESASLASEYPSVALASERLLRVSRDLRSGDPVRGAQALVAEVLTSPRFSVP